MRFADEPTADGGRSLDVVDVQAAQGRPFETIQTVWGEPLVAFHHAMLFASFPLLPRAALWDASGWFRANGPSPSGYYRQFLSLFISGCVLFESYWFIRLMRILFRGLRGF